MPNESKNKLTTEEFETTKNNLTAEDEITVVYENTKIDDQTRNPLEKTITITSISDNWILGDSVENPSRNRGYGIVSRVYGGEKKVMFVNKNYVRGMRDNHYLGPVIEIKQ